MATFEDYFFVKNTKWIFWGIGALVVLFLVFRAGMVVGFHDALRSHGLERRVPPGGPFGLPLPADTMPGHGAVGSIATITLPTLTLKTRDGMIEKIELASTTVIHDDNGNPLAPASLKTGDMAVVIGDPEDTDDFSSEGEIDAQFIRVLPAPAATTTSTTNY